MSKKKSVTLPGSYWWKKYAPKDIRDKDLKQTRKILGVKKLTEQTGPGDKGLSWSEHDGEVKLCRKGMFGGKCVPVAHASKLTALQVARQHGGVVKKRGSMYHILKEQYGMAGEQLPGDALGEGKPRKSDTLHTIKRILKGKYTKGRSLIN